MRYFKKDAPFISFSPPSTKIAVLGIFVLFFSALSLLFKNLLLKIPTDYIENTVMIESFISHLDSIYKMFLFTSIVLMVIALIARLTMSSCTKIRLMVRKGLYCYEYGNPLHLKDGERLPIVRCKKVGLGLYELSITATTVTIEDLQNISSIISSSLNKKHYSQYAVTQTFTDIAFNRVTFRLEDVTVDKSLIIHDIKELKPKEHTKLIVQKETYIDLTTSGSILVSGKTRSGKSTATISLLIQALLVGKDRYGSRITIIDPKQAELSRLPHVYTLDENGDATGILEAIKSFADTIVKRQQILNDLSEKKGDAVKWWDANFHVSFLFIDEYVSCRTIFPKRTTKDNADYSLATFDALIKRIVTMGASAGCYAIISIAEASVDEGGLPAMLRSAMTTKILFKPTLTEGRLMWDSDKLKDFNTGRVYNAGDAWFSSTDGTHDNVSYVHFPIMNFAIYRELGSLLEAYYNTK